jgi:hypothetical protein
MGDDELISLLRDSATLPRDRLPGCPDEHQVAAYVDGDLGAEDHQAFEAHLSGCDACLGLVASLSRQLPATVEDAFLPVVRAPAATRVRSAWQDWTRQAPKWAAAALVLLTIPALVRIGTVSDREDVPNPSSAERTTRNSAPASSPLRVLSPRPNDTVDAAALIVRWTELPGSPDYTVSIVTESGDLVAEGRVSGREWRPGPNVNLVRGGRYFVQVDAYPSARMSVGSDHVPFSVTE